MNIELTEFGRHEAWLRLSSILKAVMIYLIIISQILLLIMARIARTNELLRRVLLVFNAWWGILWVYSHVFPYGGYKISFDTYLLIWIFVFVFNIVFIFTKTIRNNGSQFTKEGFPTQYSEIRIAQQYDNLILGNKAITVSLFMVIIILAYYAYKYSTVVSLGSILNARNERYYVGGLFGSTLELLFYNYVIAAFRYVFTFIISFSLLYDRIKTKQFWLCVIGLVLYSYVGASRFPVVLLLVNILFLWIIRSYYNKRTINGKSISRFIRIALIFFAGIFGISYLTAFRRGMIGFNMDAVIDNFDILYDQILGYSVGPLSGLSYLLDSGTMTNHWFIGRAVILNGFEEVIHIYVKFCRRSFFLCQKCPWCHCECAIWDREQIYECFVHMHLLVLL